ncbi:hypothetical protein ES689_14220 [Frigoribacterium sp. ACAM 257]|uniref:hypothetical protein n=1 Tax=Frigoribacterium sp. ACAM 257 TaxID=2508998 RepID=UPI0011BA28B0|nr:hypothetical protein [Frigoribacterium sp. ACAM 257]TWX34994.1 hypothetical protein ES689_14220 [Frigoribacterium sp. ACAM 257]
MTYSHSATVNESGFSVVVTASTEAPKNNRSGDHATYELKIEPADGFLAEPLVWEFSGEIERATVVKALRELATKLEEF